MNYLIDDQPTDAAPHSIYSWNLGVVAVERKVGKIRVSMDLNAPNSLRVEKDGQEYLLNLSVYDQNAQGIGGLKSALDLNDKQITAIRAELPELRAEFERKARYERIIFYPPTLMSQYRYRAVLVARRPVPLDVVQKEFGDPKVVSVQPYAQIPHSVEVCSNDFQPVMDVLKNDHSLSATEMEPYAAQYRTVNCFLPWFSELERQNIPLVAKTNDGNRRWLTDSVDALTKKEYRQYVYGLKQHPNLVVKENHNEALPDASSQARMIGSYFCQLQAVAEAREQHAHKKMTFLKHNFKKVFLPTVNIASFILGIGMIPLTLTIMLLKGLAWAFTRLTPNTTYRSPGIPSLLSLVLFQSLHTPGDPFEMQIGPVGALFDITANILLNMAILVTVPITFVISGVICLIKTALDLANPLKHQALKNKLNQTTTAKENSPVFTSLNRLNLLSNVSKRYHQLVKQSLEPSSTLPARTPIQQNPTPDTQAKFPFFSAPGLPADLQDRIIQTSIDDEMASDYFPSLVAR